MRTEVFIDGFVGDSPAAAEGILQVGDCIIAANGRSLVGLTHSEALQYLVDAGDTVALVIRRYPPRNDVNLYHYAVPRGTNRETCIYVSERGRGKCVREAIRGKVHCALHDCGVRGCVAGKASDALRCSIHANEMQTGQGGAGPADPVQSPQEQFYKGEEHFMPTSDLPLEPEPVEIERFPSSDSAPPEYAPPIPRGRSTRHLMPPETPMPSLRVTRPSQPAAAGLRRVAPADSAKWEPERQPAFNPQYQPSENPMVPGPSTGAPKAPALSVSGHFASEAFQSPLRQRSSS